MLSYAWSSDGDWNGSGRPLVAGGALLLLRPHVVRTAHLVRRRTRIKNQVQAFPHRDLMPRSHVLELFGCASGRLLPIAGTIPL